jgi:hypothetical protein
LVVTIELGCSGPASVMYAFRWEADSWEPIHHGVKEVDPPDRRSSAMQGA